MHMVLDSVQQPFYSEFSNHDKPFHTLRAGE